MLEFGLFRHSWFCPAGLILHRHIGFQSPSLFGFFCLGVWTYRHSKELTSDKSYVGTILIFLASLTFAWAVNALILPSEVWLKLGAEKASPWGNLFGYYAATAVFVAAYFRKSIQYPAWLHKLGLVSYSLYLAHALAIRIGAKIFDPATQPFAYIPAALCATALLTLLGYHFIEKPCLEVIRRRRSVPAKHEVTLGGEALGENQVA
jgi:peptidoglycan/LPS O-acetylase OafA/YrhL